MSNLIPMVSSSPPPMDEKTFEWEDDDDDFGTFTGANTSVLDTGMASDAQDTASVNKNGPMSVHHISSSDESDGFADFKSFNENKIHTVSKPQVRKLPLTHETHISSANGVTESIESNDAVLGSMKRDSDSGMFSTDISPVPVSEDGTIELNSCDKTVDSVDEDENHGVPDLPVDDRTIIDQQSPADVAECDTNLCSNQEKVSENSDFHMPIKNSVDHDVNNDQCSSKGVHSISKEAAHSSIPNDTSDVQINGSENNSDEDDFGDFADFTSQKVESADWPNENNENNSVISNNERDLSSYNLETNTVDVHISGYTNTEKETPDDVVDSDSDNHSDSVPPLNLKAADLNLETDEDRSTPQSFDDLNDNNSKISDAQCGYTNDDFEKSGNTIEKDIPVSSSKDELANENVDDMAVMDVQLQKTTKAHSASVGNTTDDKDSLDEMDNASNDEFADFNGFNNDLHIKGNTGSTEDVCDTANVTAKSDNHILENGSGMQCNSDNDDDFADFSSVTVPVKSIDADKLGVLSDDSVENNDKSPGKNSVINKTDDGEFADFSSVKQPEKTDGEGGTMPSKNQDDDDDGGFADFRSAEPPVNSGSGGQLNESDFPDGDDNDFSDFGSATFHAESAAKLSSKSKDDDDDFADFSSAPFESDNVADDDNDGFADFSSAPFQSGNTAKSSSVKDDAENNDDDEFADFSSATFEPQSMSKMKDDNSGFASFDGGNSFNVDDDDWGKFDEDDEFNSGMIESEPTVKKEQRAEVPLVLTDKVKTVLHACFNINEAKEDGEEISLLDTLLIGSLYQPSPDISQAQQCEKRVIKQVYDYDNTNALIYQWKKSRSNDQLFKTLKIDTQNMFFGLKKQSVPLSATSLTILEPIRGAIDNKKDKTIPALVEPNITDSIPPLQDMPPVEFDWDNSGLTNPLEAKTLDLDFMVLQENENSIKTGVFQSELLDAPRSSVRPMQPLEDILKNMKRTTTAAPTTDAKDENLSKEADTIINSLPLLSFMKSKVLMFKLHDS